jgi:hypothetical protein
MATAVALITQQTLPLLPFAAVLNKIMSRVQQIRETACSVGGFFFSTRSAIFHTDLAE